MAKFHELSNELLLQIFDSPDLSFLDLVCISKTCYRWRLIITNCRPSNERLFLRSPAGSPPHGQGQVTSTEITMDARLRRTPNTIWNEYDGATWQLALSWDKDEATLPPPHNPILVEVAETICGLRHIHTTLRQRAADHYLLRPRRAPSQNSPTRRTPRLRRIHHCYHYTASPAQ
jgi:hypothetical protein